MNTRVRMHRWVVWWIWVGIACGVIAVVVIGVFSRELSRAQKDVILLMGVVHWALGGFVCYASDAIRIEESSEEPRNQEPSKLGRAPEQHSASDYLLPGSHRTYRPPRY